MYIMYHNCYILCYVGGVYSLFIQTVLRFQRHKKFPNQMQFFFFAEKKARLEGTVNLL